jgi:hypothetical protein
MQTSFVIAAVMSKLLHSNVQNGEVQVRKSVVFVMALLSSSAFAFDINGYCRQVANAVGGSYQIEETCRQQEYQAQANLSRKQIAPRVENYCREVGQAVGGSYQIMLTCVQQELAAKARLQ